MGQHTDSEVEDMIDLADRFGKELDAAIKVNGMCTTCVYAAVISRTLCKMLAELDTNPRELGSLLKASQVSSELLKMALAMLPPPGTRH